MTNVVDFKKVKEIKEKQKLDDITEEFETDEELAANIATLGAMEIVDAMLHIGLPIADKPECIKDILGLIESIRALAHRAQGINSPIHEVNNTLYGFIKDEEGLLADFIADMNDNID